MDKKDADNDISEIVGAFYKKRILDYLDKKIWKFYYWYSS